MRLRNITGCREMIGESEFVVHEPETMKGKWREAFGNDHPVYVEIGMGKGRFLMDMARLYPEINFIGIEKYSSVLLRAVQKLEEEELPNVRLIRMDAEDLENVFAQGELDRMNYPHYFSLLFYWVFVFLPPMSTLMWVQTF